jgi:hypothetical protein
VRVVEARYEVDANAPLVAPPSEEPSVVTGEETV